MEVKQEKTPEHHYDQESLFLQLGRRGWFFWFLSKDDGFRSGQPRQEEIPFCLWINQKRKFIYLPVKFVTICEPLEVKVISISSFRDHRKWRQRLGPGRGLTARVEGAGIQEGHFGRIRRCHQTKLWSLWRCVSLLKWKSDLNFLVSEAAERRQLGLPTRKGPHSPSRGSGHPGGTLRKNQGGGSDDTRPSVIG